MRADFHSKTLLAAYEQEDYELRLKSVRIGLILSIVLVSIFSIIDWIVYQQQFLSLIKIRFSCNTILLGILIILFIKSRVLVYIKTIGILFIMVLSFSISWMVMITDGSASTYYAGLSLILVGMSVLLPWTLFETAIVCISTILIYMAACLIHDVKGAVGVFSWSLFGSNLSFLIGTSIICMLGSYYQSAGRFETFRLNYELDQRNLELDKSNKELAELDRLKSHFFANVSHELRTPLTLILGPIDELLRNTERFPERVGEMLHTARDNSRRLLNLVNNLLEVIRLEEGKSELELRPLEVSGFLAGMADSVSHTAEIRGITLNKALADETLRVQADHNALERIFLNLLSNALKFTPEGGTVTVCSRAENGRIVVDVRDTGIGIDAAFLPYIFDRFRQADGSSTRKYPGSGLGLALVKELSEKMGGSVKARSTPGEGTTMTVTLPLWEGSTGEIVELPLELGSDGSLSEFQGAAEHLATLPLEDPVELQELDGSRGQGPTVLVVDDEPDMRRYLAGVLEENFRILQARDGRQGLEMARSHRPQLMVLDMMMPEIDGLEVCRRLKADMATRGIKIVILTARVSDEAKLAALEHGADDFLTKPFSRVELETRLRNLLQASNMERDLEQRNETLQKTLTDLRMTQGQLIQSEKLNAIGSLSAGLLHEINNPLNYAIAALQLAQLEPAVEADELLKEIVADVDEGMQRIRAIVSDLRAFAYPSEMEKQIPFSFGAAVESALRFTASEIKEIDIERELSEKDQVVGSQTHIVQVLLNLITNAAEAIDDVKEQRRGHIRIRSEARQQRLHVWVRDNGVGMDRETLARVFDPFFTTRDVGEGMGMGLSICHTIIANHSGSLEAESEPGEWTEFHFELPLMFS